MCQTSELNDVTTCVRCQGKCVRASVSGQVCQGKCGVYMVWKKCTTTHRMGNKQCAQTMCNKQTTYPIAPMFRLSTRAPPIRKTKHVSNCNTSTQDQQTISLTVKKNKNKPMRQHHHHQTTKRPYHHTTTNVQGSIGNPWHNTMEIAGHTNANKYSHM